MTGKPVCRLWGSRGGIQDFLKGWDLLYAGERGGEANIPGSRGSG